MNSLHASPDTTFPQQSLVMPAKTYCQSPFSGHQLQPDFPATKTIEKYQPDWIAGLLIGFLVLLAWAQFYYFKRVKQILKAPLTRRFLNQLTRDGNLFKERVSIAIGIVYVLAFSLLIFQFNTLVLKAPVRGTHGFQQFLIITLLFTLFWFIKIFAIQFLGFVFKTRATTREYLTNILIFSLVSGLIILPVLIVAIYLKSVLLIYCCLSLVVLFFFFRLVRGFFIGINLTKFSYIFLIVYLCSLEILPLLILVKMLLNYMRSAAL
jgi:hypothetical protein